MTRQLLNRRTLASKMGYKSASALDRNTLDQLYRLGFPQPVIPFGIKRWDPVAVDAWLDSRVPEHLRNVKIVPSKIDPVAAEQILRQRARGMVTA